MVTDVGSHQTTEAELLHRFLTEQLEDGGRHKTVAELMKLFPAFVRQCADDFEAIRRGLADVNAGRTRPFAEFWREFCQQRNLLEA